MAVFLCPTCHLEAPVGDDLIGRTGKCSKCGSRASIVASPIDRAENAAIPDALIESRRKKNRKRNKQESDPLDSKRVLPYAITSIVCAIVSIPFIVPAMLGNPIMMLSLLVILSIGAWCGIASVREGMLVNSPWTPLAVIGSLLTVFGLGSAVFNFFQIVLASTSSWPWQK